MSKVNLLLTRKSGFTLIELLVSITVTALLSSFVIIYSSGTRAQTALSVERAKLTQVIVRAKSLALSTYGASAPPCGYGVHVDRSARAYELFTYTAADCSQIPFIDPEDAAHYRSLNRYLLPAPLAFEDGQNVMSEVLFVPPDPKTFVWSGGALLQAGTGKIYLTTQDGAGHTSVQVSPAGQISF